MPEVVELESELRILDIDEVAVIAEINKLGGKKIFDGRLETRIFNSVTAEKQQKFRLRWVFGLEFFNNSDGSIVTKPINCTEKCYKIRLPSAQVSGVPTPRRYEEVRQGNYDGNALDLLSTEYQMMGMKMIALDVRERVSYGDSSGRRFEIDRFLRTTTFGDRRLPSMLEIQTTNEELTRKTVLELGYKLNDPHVVDWKLLKIFDYYSKLLVPIT